MTRSSLIRYARIALIAMLWQLIALPLSNAAAASGGMPGEVPVCTAAGIKWVQFDGQPSKPESTERSHCPLCVLGQADAAVVDTHAGTQIPASLAQAAAPLSLASLFQPLATAAPPPARGPPSYS